MFKCFKILDEGRRAERKELYLDIKSLDFHFDYGLLFVGLDKSLQVANISYNSEDESLSISEFEETLVSKIHSDTNSTNLKLESVTVDWLNHGVYICVKSSKMTQTENWSLVLCDLTLERCRLMRLQLNSQPKYLTAGNKLKFSIIINGFVVKICIHSLCKT